MSSELRKRSLHVNVASNPTELGYHRPDALKEPDEWNANVYKCNAAEDGTFDSDLGLQILFDRLQYLATDKQARPQRIMKPLTR